MCKFNAVSLLVYEDCTPGLPHSISVHELSVYFFTKEIKLKLKFRSDLRTFEISD